MRAAAAASRGGQPGAGAAGRRHSVRSAGSCWLPVPRPQAHMWQLDFAVAPEVLKDVNHELRVNEQVLRWVVVKKEQYPPLHDLRHMLANSERLAVPGVLDSAAAAQPPPAAGGAGGSPAAQP